MKQTTNILLVAGEVAEFLNKILAQREMDEKFASVVLEILLAASSSEDRPGISVNEPQPSCRPAQ
ncbi:MULTISPECIES: hypothetical protein [Serratia]|uniref:hypothetical protein n=1 Tax=Serratia TaxID=613 RepID=UPI001249A931|nr:MULTISPECIES: hypothetical protein [Serratia]